jgi:hypothetical protein
MSFLSNYFDANPIFEKVLIMITKKIAAGLILLCGQLSVCSQDSKQDVKDSDYQLSDNRAYRQKDVKGWPCKILIKVDSRRSDFSDSGCEALQLFSKKAKAEGWKLAEVSRVELLINPDEGALKGEVKVAFWASYDCCPFSQFLGNVKQARQTSFCQASDLGVAEGEQKQRD